MINLDTYIRNLETNNLDQQESIAYQEKLLDEYLNKGTDLRKEQLKARRKAGQKADDLRKELAAIDLEYFGRAYLPHYFIRKSPEFHNELNAIWEHGVLKDKNPYCDAKEISRLDGCKRVVAAPRGHAKSTNFTFKNALHATLYQYKHYILILSDSSEQAEGFLNDIATELEDNPLIRSDFGDLKDYPWNSSTLRTNTDIKIEAIGSGKKVRGRRHRNYRPDLIILDDIENDENVNTIEQRRKLENWFYKAVSKAGDTYTDIVYIGTMLHYDSLLAKVMKNPMYKAVKYQGVISFAKNQSLWDAWELIYVNLENDNREHDAKVFFEANREEMLEGTKVLWEAKLSYYDLMCIKISEGESSFNSEIQNDPIDPDSCTFNPEWFDYYNEAEVDFKSGEFIFIGAVDPSLGKNKKSDTSAIVAIAKNVKSGYMYGVEASVEKRKPDIIIEDIIEMNKRLKRDYGKGFTKLGVETVQFQQFFKDVLAKVSAERGEYLPIEEIYNTVNKIMRIESLQPIVKNKYFKFNLRHKTLIEQMKVFPMGRNDDAPDTLEMAIRLALKTGSSKADYLGVLKRGLKFRKGAY
ncbi:phage terminase large subunit [Cellulosilyticum sp. I15G10I2]|uniref:phage terminase large subunit n=1 Tax=Cellulosilyticum sp. I15G10I2 TaxID=1892843 RepID=UPI00085BE6C3|nr:phage terminase large subunit [Cellulosilyticum sp. I15G10I2]